MFHIPVKEINAYLIESISHLLNMEYKNFEVIIFPDEKSTETFEKTKIIPTGKFGPAEKRDLALKFADGEILAFLDDDAYPRKDWLKNLVKNFSDQEIAGVGGPALTPDNDTLEQKASGLVFESILGGGNTRFRYLPTKRKYVDDFPTVNFSVRRKVFEKLGGFNTNYWPGEDTKLCLDIDTKLKKKIVYDPEVVVFHHRKPLFKEHLKQISNYALHRGFFAKKYPKNSLKIGYFIPSGFLVYLPVSWFIGFIEPIILVPLMAYLIFLFLTGLSIFLKHRTIKLSILTMIGIFLTHVFYGFYFLKGLRAKELKR